MIFLHKTDYFGHKLPKKVYLLVEKIDLNALA